MTYKIFIGVIVIVATLLYGDARFREGKESSATRTRVLEDQLNQYVLGADEDRPGYCARIYPLWRETRELLSPTPGNS